MRTTERKLSDETIKSTDLDTLNYKLREGFATDADAARAVEIINTLRKEGLRLYAAKLRSCPTYYQVELFDDAPKPKAPRMIEVDSETYHDGTNGACLACGEIQYGGCEPDARGYECESCGAKKVYGLEELVMMGRIKVEE